MTNYEELEAPGLSPQDYLKILKRRRKLFMIAAGSVFAVILLAALLWPPTYRSTATILIEEQELPQEFVQSTITTFANQQIEVIKQRVLTMRNIMEIVRKYELYSEEELQRMPRTEVAEEFTSKTRIQLINAQVIDPRSGRPGEATIAFSISYDHGNPRKAQKATNELTDLFLNENQKDRTERSRGASQFLADEAQTLSQELARLEQQIASFKEQHAGALPEVYQFNLGVLERSERELLDVALRYKELEKRELQLESELAQMTPYAPTVLPSGEQVLSDYDRLKALETEYRRMSAIYSADHPDVRRLNREIRTLKNTVGGLSTEDRAAQLRSARDELAALRERYTDDHPKVMAQERYVEELLTSDAAPETEAADPDNPAWILLNTQLQSTKSEMKILSEKETDIRAKIQRLEKQMADSPSVERDYSALQREYLNTQQKYGEIKTKLMSAEVAKNLEQDRKGQRFALIEPPALPEQPVSPNRVIILLLGVVLAGGAGIGSVTLAEMLHPVVRGARSIEHITGSAPLVAVPYLKTDADRAKTGTPRIILYFAIIVAIGIIALLLFHFLVKPLDVTWYILLRKLGIG